VTAPVPDPRVEPVAQEALSVLRLTDADVDADRMRRHAATIWALIDGHLDREVPLPLEALPGPVFDAAVQATAELYRRKDAPFGVVGAWGTDGEAIRVARDPLTGVESMLAPYKTGWGIA
jgi:hypothetical protein